MPQVLAFKARDSLMHVKAQVVRRVKAPLCGVRPLRVKPFVSVRRTWVALLAAL
jgi:hypothetical protein